MFQPGDGVPVPHDQPQDFVRLIEARKITGVCHLAAEGFLGIRSRNKGGEESVELLNVHRPTTPSGILRDG
jgi:hypothetical protein